MSDEPRKDGLHCVYGKCRADMAQGQMCHPGCSFQMSVIPETEVFRRVIVSDPRDARIAELEAENTRLREALKPFADFADRHGYVHEATTITRGSAMAKRQLTMGDAYLARAALEHKP